jgi:predicted small lipoprotein YifL
MIKKISLILLLSIIITSCGKKGCPKDPEKIADKCNTIYKK